MYPPIQPHASFLLPVDRLSNGQEVKIHVECCGNPKGVMVLYLHGGPGDSISPRLRRFYNPTKYHIVLFDQRGCGKSEPRNHTEKNTTKHLLSDIECIRKHIGYEKMVVAGGSWGSSLAMLYAQAHPTRVSGLILRGVYDLSKDDLLDCVYPENEEKLNTLLGLTKNKTTREEDKRIARMLKGKTKKRKDLVRLLADPRPAHVTTKHLQKDSFKDAETLTVVGEHYESHHYFVPRKTIYKNMHKIKHIPTIMVEGRYDIVTPMKIAFSLQKLFKDCKLIIVPSGHSADEKEIAEGMVQASTMMLRKI